MNLDHLRFQHKIVHINNTTTSQVEIYEHNENFKWYCCLLEKFKNEQQNKSYLKNYVHKCFFDSSHQVIKESSGRPVLLKNNKKSVSISVSHKDNLYVVGKNLKKRHLIGIDAEVFEPGKDYSFILKSMHSGEVSVVDELQKKFKIDLNKAYLCIWTMKECIIKIFNKKINWHDIEIKLSKYNNFQLYIKRSNIKNTQFKMYFYNNIIISVAYI